MYSYKRRILSGNTWGYCTDGSEGVGCGDQETFINCADITINSQAGGGVPSKTAINPWIAYYRDPVYPKKTDSPSPLKPLIIRRVTKLILNNKKLILNFNKLILVYFITSKF